MKHPPHYALRPIRTNPTTAIAREQRGNTSGAKRLRFISASYPPAHGLILALRDRVGGHGVVRQKANGERDQRANRGLRDGGTGPTGLVPGKYDSQRVFLILHPYSDFGPLSLALGRPCANIATRRVLDYCVRYGRFPFSEGPKFGPGSSNRSYRSCGARPWRVHLGRCVRVPLHAARVTRCS
jgi:hypothetical protein